MPKNVINSPNKFDGVVSSERKERKNEYLSTHHTTPPALTHLSIERENFMPKHGLSFLHEKVPSDSNESSITESEEEEVDDEEEEVQEKGNLQCLTKILSLPY